MTNYRRTFICGGSFFFTANLAERRLRLLVDDIDAADNRSRFGRKMMGIAAALPILRAVLLCGAEWRSPRSYLVAGFERDPAPIQKQAEHIKPADHKHDLARDRLTVLV